MPIQYRKRLKIGDGKMPGLNMQHWNVCEQSYISEYETQYIIYMNGSHRC